MFEMYWRGMNDQASPYSYEDMPTPSVSAKDCIKIINIPWQGVRIKMYNKRLLTDVMKMIVKI